MKIKENHEFIPPLLIRNRHIQSIMNSLGPRKFQANKILNELKSKRVVIKTKKDVRLIAEHTLSNAERPQRKIKYLVVLLHGWEGSSESAYMVTTTNTLLVNGFDVLRLNFRDHGDSHNLNKELFNSTRIEEVGDAIQEFKEQNQYQKILLGGFSLGGNFALRISSDRGNDLSIAATIAICPPIDPNNALKKMNDSLFIYHYYFIKRWKRSLNKKLKYFPNKTIEGLLKKAKTLRSMNETFIPKLTEFSTPEDYFKSYALSGERLNAISSPTHIIMSKDDPIIPSEDISKLCENKHIHREIYKYGGHCGFIENLKGESWLQTRFVMLFERYL